MATLAARDSRAYLLELVKSATLDAAAGLWLFTTAFIFNDGDYRVLVNNLFCGGAAIIFALGPFARARLAWLLFVLGGWIAISPFALGFTHNLAATWSNVFTGIAIVALAYRAWSVRKSADEAGFAEPE